MSWLQLLTQHHSTWGGLLHVVFPFDELPSPDYQDNSHFQQLRQQLREFAAAVEEGAAGVWRDEDKRAFATAVGQVARAELFVHADYGCVVLVHTQIGCWGEETAALEVIGLDQHTFAVHSSSSSGGGSHHEFTSTTGAPAELIAGCVPSRDLPQLQDMVDRLLPNHLVSAKARSGERGHQRTPALIHSVYSDAVRALNNGASADGESPVIDVKASTQPKGGFTDVGLHTGGRKRPTSWPLVTALLWYMLHRVNVSRADPSATAAAPPELHETPGLVHQLALAQLELWLLETQLQQLSDPAGYPTALLDALMQMLLSAARRSEALSEHSNGVQSSHKHTLFDLAQRCEAAREQLDDAFAMVLRRQGAEYRLAPLEDRLGDCERSFRHPCLAVPACGAPVSEQPSKDQRRRRATAALRGVPALVVENANLGVLVSYLAETIATQKGDSYWYHVALANIEEQFILLARTHLGVAELSVDDATNISRLLDYHTRIVAHIAKQWPDSRDLLDVERQSRATLWLWIAYCCTHQAAHRAYPGLQLQTQYSVPLRFGDLRHLVLSNRLALEALQAVAAYLERHTVKQRPELFSLRPGKECDAYCLADAYYRLNLGLPSQNGDEPVQAIAQRESTAARQRRADHWTRVQQQKAVAEQLRATHRRVQAEYDALMATHDRDYLQKYWLENQLYNLAQEINTALKPMPLFQPLPQAGVEAGRVLFFLRMPLAFRLLATLGFRAQHALVKVAATLNDSRGPQQAYLDYHCNHGGWRPPASTTTTTTQVVFHLPVAPPSRPGPPTLDGYYTDSDGVYHPSSSPFMFWHVDGYNLNPFHGVLPEQLARGWTTSLGGKGHSAYLQSAATLYDESDRARGNDPVARPNRKPSWLTKEQHMHFAGLRAFPLQQLRNLCRALHEDKLPLERSEVHALLRQTLFHVGELVTARGDHKVAFSWKRDFYLGQARVQLRDELQAKARLLAVTPARYQALPAVIDLAAFVASFDGLCIGDDDNQPSLCAPMLRELAHAVTRMAEEQNRLIERAAREGRCTDAELQRMKAKRAVLLAYALRCFRFQPSDLTREDVAAMCRLVAQLHHAQPVIASNTRREPIELIAISLRCASAEVLAPRLRDVLRHVDNAALTDAARSVLECIPSEPLIWRRLATSDAGFALSSTAPPCHSSCWEADHDGNLYSFNLLTGAVLFNGAPPGRLPADVVSYSLYRETFGDRNFEVVTCKDGVSLRTARAIGGVYYEFTPACSSSTANLLIVEHSGASKPTRLQLLAVGANAAWGDELPRQLRELHSYWRDLDSGVILLRGRTFLKREVHFVLQREQASVDSNRSWMCWRVPSHERSSTKAWPDLVLDDYDQLMVCPATPPTDRTLLALTKLENPAFIHVFRRNIRAVDDCQEPRWLYELPRFQLHFHLHDTGLVQATDYRGYMLALNQQLPDALANLRQYLILEPIPRDLQPSSCAGVAAEPSAPQLRLLLPDGIVRRREHEVFVEVADNVRSSVHHVLYDYDDRFRQFKASGINARLQLAALHSATSTLLPEPRVGMTGTAMAMALVRQCWVQHPLSREELAKLANVAQFSARAPALHLLCYALECSSLQLGFLHPREEDVDAANQRALRVKQLKVPRRDEATAFVPLNVDAATEYRIGMARRTIGLHHQLTPEEEELVFRYMVLPAPKALVRPSPPLSTAAGKEGFVQSLELALAACVRETPRDSAVKPECPVSAGADATAMDRYHAERCQVSWNLHHTLPTRTLDSERLHSIDIDYRLRSVKARQRKLEQQMREILEGHASGATTVFRIRRAAGLVPRATVADWVRCAWLHHAVLLQRLNPHLSDDQCLEFRGAIVQWLQLCVLRDRLLRLRHLMRAFDDELARAAASSSRQKTTVLQNIEHQLVQELLTRREWDPVNHVQWLAFEAEGRLQVRPTQYRMAETLLANPHAIAQLNMGEGKTRVILPLLVLHHTAAATVGSSSTASSRPPLVRLVFLPQLLDDAYRHLHRHLCASAVLGRRQLLRLPFHRDVQPTEANVRVLRHALQQCASSGGALLMAPAHVLSMQLKCDELWLRIKNGCVESAATRKALLIVSRELPYVTILDETDEILRHTYQLLYAAGSSQPLPQGPARWHCVQAVLRLMHRAWSAASKDGSTESQDNDASARLRLLLQQEMDRREDHAPGAFGTCQLKTAADAMAKVERELGELLLTSLCADPPHELAWLKEYQEGAAARQLKRWVLDSHTAPGEDSSALSDTRRDEMLALRGLLGLGVLASTLRLRSQVEFGIDVRRIKRLAVPFRANNTPSDRAEFAHMDRSLLLTHLAYYDIGLSEKQLREAITKLKGMAQAQRTFHYGRWLRAARSAMTLEEQDQLQDDNRIDLTNAAQWHLLSRLYRHNIETINFWLANIVLPDDTAQFDKRLTATPWMLADDSRGCYGFSGTNDNNLLLPLQVRPFEPTDQDSPLRSLGATNGHMLACLLEHCRGVTVVGGNEITSMAKLAVDDHHPPPPPQQQPLLWKQALALAVERKMDAFIDAGALLVGVSNAEAAQFVLQLMPRPHRYQGVVYSLVDSAGRQEWRVRGLQGQEWPLTSSPVQERDAFVLFDQHQCRGADKKLRQDAMGMLSLGPSLCKDALMQAAGRMRQLGRGQCFEFVLPVAVAADVARVCQLATNPPMTLAMWSDLIRPAHLLPWVMANTTEATAAALPLWAEQGLHFVQAKMHRAAHHDDALVGEERLTVKALYDCARRGVTVAEAVQSRVACMAGGQQHATSSQETIAVVADAIAKRAREYGSDIKGTLSTTDEECERELERFQEEEQEQEVEETENSPATDEVWDLARAWTASSPQQIADRVEPFVDMLRRVDPDWMAMGWKTACVNPTNGQPRVYCTTNFGRPLANGSSQRYADPTHMHTADAYLLWPRTGEVLLLSPMETDAALRAYWDLQARTIGHGPVLGHLAYARRVVDTKTTGPVRLCLPAAAAACLPVPTLAVLQLFNGETKFGSEEHGDERQRVVEQQLVCSRSAALQAKRLPEVRGKGSELLLSHLELAIKRHA